MQPSENKSLPSLPKKYDNIKTPQINKFKYFVSRIYFFLEVPSLIDVSHVIHKLLSIQNISPCLFEEAKLPPNI